MKYAYLHGFGSGPSSTKANFFYEKFAELDIELEVPDLAPDFERMTVLTCLRVIAPMLEHDHVVLLGSSLGGYVAALAAHRYPEQVSALVLMAPAFDVARHCEKLLGPAEVAKWEATGTRLFDHHVLGRPEPLSVKFLQDARHHPPYPEVTCRALIFAGRQDTVVPLARIKPFVGPDRELVLLEDDHSLTRDLPGMWARTQKFLKSLGLLG